MEDAALTGPRPDEELVRRARGGDRGAMGELVERHHGAVYRLALMLLHDEEEAADATQETFMKAFRGLRGFRGDAAFRTWLLAIASNEVRGMLRRRSRRREAPLGEVEAYASDDPGPEEETVRRGEAQRLLRVLRKLPEKQRQAVTLRIFEGLSFREVGAVIGSSEGAARVNYHHGIKRLRELLR